VFRGEFTNPVTISRILRTVAEFSSHSPFAFVSVKGRHLTNANSGYN
jgi:hypothetical protein